MVTSINAHIFHKKTYIKNVLAIGSYRDQSILVIHLANPLLALLNITVSSLNLWHSLSWVGTDKKSWIKIKFSKKNLLNFFCCKILLWAIFSFEASPEEKNRSWMLNEEIWRIFVRSTFCCCAKILILFYGLY